MLIFENRPARWATLGFVAWPAIIYPGLEVEVVERADGAVMLRNPTILPALDAPETVNIQATQREWLQTLLATATGPV